MLALNSLRNLPALVLFTLASRLPSELALSAQHAFRVANRAWFLWVLYWLAMAFVSKSTKRRESVWQRLEHLIPLIGGCALIFSEELRGSWLGRVVFPDNPVLMLISVGVTILALLFSVWARIALGANWSGTVTIKANHQLIRRGPYRFVRHPIYTGILTALLATAVTQQMLGALLGFAIVLQALYRKALREESFLSQEFGDAFAEHRRHTGMFLPRVS